LERGSSSDHGSDEGAGGFDLKGKVNILWRRKTIIISTAIVITLIIGLLAFALPPRYAAVASILLEEGRSNVVDAQATGESVLQEPTDSSTLAAEVNLLRSRMYAQAVVEELDLLMKPEFNPVLEGKIGPLQILAERFSKLADLMPDSILIDTGICKWCPVNCKRAFIDVEIEGARGRPWSKIPLAEGWERVISGNTCPKGLLEDANEMRAVKTGMEEQRRAFPNIGEMVRTHAFRRAWTDA
jgi:hypothetical protein